MAGPALLITPTQGSFDEGFDGRLEKNEARRKANRDALMELGDKYAAQGVGFGIDEWLKQSQGLLGTYDMLNSTSLPSDMLEAMRKAQNAKAAQTVEERRRAQFKEDFDEANLMEQDVAKQAEAGKGEGEIAAYLTSTYGARAARVVPRINYLMNTSMLRGQTQGQQLGSSLYSEDDAKSYIDSNPGLTPGMKQGVMEKARANQTELEKQAYTVGNDVAATGGFVDNDTMRQAIVARTPLYLKDERLRQKWVDDAMTVARGAAQTKSTSVSRANTANAQNVWGQNAFNVLQAQYAAEAQDEQQRRASAQQAMKDMTAPLAAQDQFVLKGVDANGRKLDPKYGQRLAGYAAEYSISDIGGLVDAIQARDEDRIKKIISISEKRGTVLDRARKLAEFNNNTGRITTFDGAQNAIAPLVTDPEVPQQLGKAYQQLVTAAGGENAVGAGITMEKRVVKVPIIHPQTGQVIQYRDEEQMVPVASGAGGEQQQSNAALAATARERFVDVSASLINGAASAMETRYAATPEQANQMVQNFAQRRATAFVSGMGLKGDVANAKIGEITQQIVLRVGPMTTGFTHSETALERHQRAVQTLQQQGGVIGPSNTVPGSVQPSPRPGGAAPNQWWNR